jgi:hypothetical protein
MAGNHEDIRTTRNTERDVFHHAYCRKTQRYLSCENATETSFVTRKPQPFFVKNLATLIAPHASLLHLIFHFISSVCAQ